MRDKVLKVQCRLDYVIMSKSLLNVSKECMLIFASNTDHSAVVTLVQSEELSRKPGPGFWKFNSSLLEDNEYVNGIHKGIVSAKDKYKWDLIKMELRSFSIAYAKRKASKQRSHEKDLQNQLNALLANSQNSRNNPHYLHELHKLQAELNKIMEHKIKGTILRRSDGMKKEKKLKILSKPRKPCCL